MANKTTDRRRILIVDDKKPVRDHLQKLLENNGYATATAATGPQALDLLAQGAQLPIDLVLLDILLENANYGGQEVMSEIRSTEPKHKRVLIVVRSGRAEPQNRKTYLRDGADAFVSTDADDAELLAVLFALFRRQDWDRNYHEGPRVIECGDLRIDLKRSYAYLNGQQLNLAPREFAVLRHLAENPGRVCRSDEIIEDVFGPLDSREALHQSIHRLREALGDDAQQPRYIMGHRGIGYELICN